MNFACFMKSSLCRNSPASVKMSPPLPKPKSYQSVHTERGCALAPVRGKIPQLVTAPSDRLMPQPCEKIRKRHPSDSIYFRPFHARVS